jgi:hypothetical protein
LGWYDPEVKVISGTPKEPETFILHGFIDDTGKHGHGHGHHHIKIVKFDRKQPHELYMMFNWKHGRNSDTKKGKNKVVVVKQKWDGVNYAESILKASIGPNNVWIDEQYFDDACDLNITVGDMDLKKGTVEVIVTGCVDSGETDAPTGPTTSPTQAPTFIPTTACVPLDGYCASEKQCCDDGQGQCHKIWDNDGFNTKIVCLEKATDTPPAGPPGKCNDNGICEIGEHCLSCPRDCNALLSGPREDRYCCNGQKRTATVPYSVYINDTRCECDL